MSTNQRVRRVVDLTLRAPLLALLACSDSGTNAGWPGPYDGVNQPASAGALPFAGCQQNALSLAPLRCQAASGAQASVLAICGDLSADNTLDVESRAAPHVDAALWVQGHTETSAPLTVEGDFIANGGNDAHNTQSISGTTRADAALACSRAPSVRDFGTSFPGAAEAVHITQPTSQTLASCQYASTDLSVDNELTLRITGHVSWLIRGDLHIAAPMRVELDPDASFELLIAGALEIDNTLAIGDTARPEASFVAVGGSIHVAAPTQLYGSLLAPESDVRADNTLTIQGGAYLGSLHVAAPMVVQGEGAFSEQGCSL